MTRRTVFTLFATAYFMSYFYRSANAVIAPDLSQEMALSPAQLGLMTSLFFAAFAAVQIPLGFGLDRWGPRWVTPGLMLAAVAGSLIFAAAPSLPSLALGRALIGMGMAGVLMGSLKIFSQWFPAHRYATATGMLVGIGSLGALFAATPLAWLNAGMGWRSIFVFSAGATAVISAAILIWTRNTPPGVEWQGGHSSEGSLRAVINERRFWLIAPLTFFLAGTLLGFQGLWAGPYLFDSLHLTDLEAGNVLLLLGIGATIGYGVSGWLADRYGMARVMVVVTTIFILSQVVLAFHPSLAWVRFCYIVFGFSGSFNVMLVAQARQIFPLHMTGMAVTAVNMFAIGGVFLLQWWMGLIVGMFPTDASGAYPPIAYSTALLFTATCAFLSLLWYLPMARRVPAYSG